MPDEKKRPDFVLQAAPKDGSQPYARVGAAWVGVSSEGVEFITLRLNPGVRLAWDDDLWLTLWPNDKKKTCSE